MLSFNPITGQFDLVNPAADISGKLDLAGGTMTGQLVLQLASATGAVNVSPTWNNGATTFAGIYGRVTNTASGASSKLIDLGTVAGGSMFSISKTGHMTCAGGFFTTEDAFYGFDNSTGWGMGWKSGGVTVAVVNNNVGQGQLTVVGGIGISGATFPYPDVTLFRTGEGRMALRNQTGYIGSTIYPSVVAQAFEVYNTYTSSTNYERFVIDWQASTNVVKIGTERGSTGGDARDVEIVTDNATRITVKASGAILFSGLPLFDPGVSGQLWNDSGTLKISP